MNKFAIILAAGQGTRMQSKLYKVLHPVCGKPMVEHVVDNIRSLDMMEVITIVGHGSEDVRKRLGDKSAYVVQDEQLGTGHAVTQAEAVLGDKEGVTVVICGDTPLIRKETLEQLIQAHIEARSKATILTAIAPIPFGYGRIIRDSSGAIEKIVEQKDCNEQETLVQEVNTGTYCFDNQLLFETLKKVGNNNAQQEYYLTDVIEILRNDNQVVSAFCTPDFDETLGVNDRVQLAQAEKLMQMRVNEMHMRKGVSIPDPTNTYIGMGVEIGRDTVIKPGTILSGTTTIGEDCVIGPHTEISDCQVANTCVIRQSVLFESSVGANTQIGPFAHIRPGSNLKENVKIGNFVEVKKSTIENDSKVSHLSYIGDTVMGSDLNVGCGKITVNYDGKNKHLTTIEDGAFIGCNTNLVAPVTVGKNSIVAAGSTITKDVPEDALSIARAQQVDKEGYAKKLR